MLKIVAILKSLPHHACAEEMKGMKKGQLSYHGSFRLPAENRTSRIQPQRV
jgi:hypothetical protein